jgi:hypothetical protein
MDHNYVGTFCNKLIFYGQELLALRPTPQPGGPPLAGCPRLLIQYISSYPPYLEGVSSVRNLRMLHTRKLHNLYCSPSKIRIFKSKRMRWARLRTNGAKRNAYRILVVKLEGWRPLGRPRYRCVDNIKMDPREIEMVGISGEGFREHGNELSGPINSWEVLEYLHN